MHAHLKMTMKCAAQSYRENDIGRVSAGGESINNGRRRRRINEGGVAWCVTKAYAPT